MNNAGQQLLLATRRGDEPAARSLWHAYAPRLIAYARSIVRRTGTPQDAEDIVQTVFCRMLRADLDDLALVDDVGAWLAQVTRRTSLNWLRTNRRERARRGRAHPASSGDAAAPSDAELADAIERLPARLREVVVLKHAGGLTFDQIELATGVSRNTAAARYRAAVERLRSMLRDRDVSSVSFNAKSPREKLVHHG